MPLRADGGAELLAASAAGSGRGACQLRLARARMRTEGTEAPPLCLALGHFDQIASGPGCEEAHPTQDLTGDNLNFGGPANDPRPAEMVSMYHALESGKR